MKSRKEINQGMNWISQHKRLAIYLRDGLSCCYCGKGIESEIKLTLDHVKPYSKGGSNKETNLVTCCLTCNSARGNRSVKKFCEAAVNFYTDNSVSAVSLEKEIKSQLKKSLDLVEAKKIVNRRGSCAKAIEAMGA